MGELLLAGPPGRRKAIMDLYVIRHADALPLGDHITDDADRPLTDAGTAQAKALAQCLQRLGVHLDVVLSSPLLRARQTAETMLRSWSAPVPPLEVVDELVNAGKRKKLSRLLRDVGKESVAIIGHQPDLSAYVAWLIGSKKASIDLEKSGVALIRCSDRPGRGAGTLIWLATPQWFIQPSSRHAD
jgi:phosphohistidine phosphatase